MSESEENFERRQLRKIRCLKCDSLQEFGDFHSDDEAQADARMGNDF